MIDELDDDLDLDLDLAEPYAGDLVARVLVERLAPLSLREIGDVVGVSRETIRKIEAQGLANLRRALESAGVDPVEVLEHLARRPLEHSLEGEETDRAARLAHRDHRDRRGRKPDTRPVPIASIGFESEVGRRLERALVELEVEADLVQLAAVIERHLESEAAE